MRYSHLLLDILGQYPFVGIPKLEVFRGNSFEYYQHAHMIIHLYNWHHLGLIDTNWYYTPLRPHPTIKNLPDAIFYNPLLGDYITIQYKYKISNIYSYLDQERLCKNYYQTDLLLLGLSNNCLFEKQILYNNYSFKNIIFQNYNYMQYKAIDPNITIKIFELYNNKITSEKYKEVNDIFLNSLNTYYYNKSSFINPNKQNLLNLIKNSGSHDILVSTNSFNKINE